MKKILSRHQRTELLKEHRLEHNKKFADRIKTILLLDQGWSPNKIAEALFIDDSTVRRYRKAYELGGLEELIEDGLYWRHNKIDVDSRKDSCHSFAKSCLFNHKRDYLLCKFRIRSQIQRKRNERPSSSFRLYSPLRKNSLNKFFSFAF